MCLELADIILARLAWFPIMWASRVVAAGIGPLMAPGPLEAVGKAMGCALSLVKAAGQNASRACSCGRLCYRAQLLDHLSDIGSTYA